MEEADDHQEEGHQAEVAEGLVSDADSERRGDEDDRYGKRAEDISHG